MRIPLTGLCHLQYDDGETCLEVFGTLNGRDAGRLNTARGIMHCFDDDVIGGICSQ